MFTSILILRCIKQESYEHMSNHSRFLTEVQKRRMADYVCSFILRNAPCSAMISDELTNIDFADAVSKKRSTQPRETWDIFK